MLDHLPAELLDVPAVELAGVLGKPSLIDVAGELDPPVFLSVLLHGNETSGWDGLRRFLGVHPVPRRGLAIFIGNVDAAAANVRVLPDQADYNRIWKDAAGTGGALASAVLAALADRVFFAAVDLHNNTGHNPYYSVVTDLGAFNLGLAGLFSDKCVYIEEPDTVLTRVFSGRCPAVALEVGPTGDPRGAERVYDFLERCLEVESISDAAVNELQLFRAQGRVHVRESVDFEFAGENASAGDAALTLTGGMEAVNFHELPPGSVFGASGEDFRRVLAVKDPRHAEITERFFLQDGRDILLKQTVIPAMYTTDPYVVRQDCLCYFMERMKPPAP